MFKCNLCTFQCGVIRKYDLHYYLHRNWPKAQFVCRRVNCEVILASYFAYKQHVFRFHNTKNEDTNIATNKNKYLFPTINNYYYCKARNCNFLSFYKKQLFLHIYSHFKELNFKIACPFSILCKSEIIYSNIKSFRSHVFRKHKIQHDPVNYTATCSSPAAFEEEKSTLSTQDPELFSPLNNSDSSKDGLKKLGVNMLANMYITLQSKFFLCDKSLQTIIDGFSDLELLNNAYMKHLCKENGFDLNKTDFNFLSETLFKVAQHKTTGLLRTSYIRKKYFKENFNFVEPIKVGISSDNDASTRFYYYVPILGTLKNLLTVESIFQQVTDTDINTNTFYQDITDGDVHKKNIFFCENQFSIKIILYQDAFEICNPLGSARKKYKIVGIYMTLANLFPWHRTQTEHISLVALCFEKDLKKYGFSKILEKFIRDISYLEETGITLDNGFHLKGTIIAIVGDNLGSHQIGGFVENFRTDSFFCRWCYVNNFNNNSYSKIFEPRNRTSYDFDVNYALTLGSMYRGLKEKSSLNDLKYFHIADGLPPCFGHDVLEGIASYDLMLALSFFVENKIITFDFLNKKLSTLRFQYEQTCCVPPIQKGDKIKGSASEILFFLNIFPIIMYEKLEFFENCTVWKMILILRNILIIIMAFRISGDQIAILNSLIEEYVSLRVKNFLNVPLRPKHHFLFHYPSLIRKFGPLRHVWSLRFEAKHRYFKNIIRHSPNFKNVLKSLAEKHQFLQAFNLNNNNMLYSNKIASVDIEKFVMSNFPEYWQTLIGLFLPRIGYISQNVSFKGITYKSGIFLCSQKDQFSHYILCQIHYILIEINLEKIYFIGKKFKAFYNCQSGLLSEIIYLRENTTTSNIFIPYDELSCVEPLLTYNFYNEKVFCFKSAPLEYY